MTPQVIAIVGPTAAGKSELGLAVAHACGGEVLNADSMQLYRGMDIGTAKLTVGQRESVPHHLLDIWPVTTRASLADYQQRAVAAGADILDRGRTPVVVGGSGLYVQALLDQMAIPPTDPALRAALEADLEREGSGALHRRLIQADPAAAQRILPSNGRRIVRALEVVELTGSYRADLPPGGYRWPATVQIGLDADDIDARIALRVHRMFAAGLVDEVRRLEREGLRDGVTAARALGYAQVLTDPATAPERTEQVTRRLVRRQRSFFRRDPRICWVSSPREGLAALAALG